MRDVKKIHHFLYSYSTDQFDSREQYLEFNPGNEYVDIIAFDDYQNVRNVERRARLFFRLKSVVDIAETKNKFATLSETVLEIISVKNWFTNVLFNVIKSNDTVKRIAYVKVWRNAWAHQHYAPNPVHPSSTDFTKFKEDLLTQLKDDLPNMYKNNKYSLCN